MMEPINNQLSQYINQLESLVCSKQEEINRYKYAMIRTLVSMLEVKDEITGKHLERVREYVEIIINGLKEKGYYLDIIENWDVGLVSDSSQLHDVGKAGVPDGILLKEGKLSDSEFSIVKRHPEMGVVILEKIEIFTVNDFLYHAKVMAASHHEKWDGSGYPLGLKRDDIPLEGRIMAVADVYDALTNVRPYKKAYTHSESMGILLKESGHTLDPIVVKVFTDNACEIKKTYARYSTQI